MLGKSELLALCNQKPQIETVTIEGLGEVCIKPINAAQSYRLDLELYREGQTGEVVNGGQKARLVAMSLCDTDGKNLFTVLDGNALGSLPVDVLDKLHAECLRVSKIGPGYVKDAAKN